MNSSLLKSFTGIAVRLGTALALLALLCGMMFAQETTGSIQGTVTDPTGAAVPNAKIVVTGGALPQAITLTTDSTGSYSVPSVPSGNYAVATTASGFSTIKKTDIPVIIGRATRVDFKMEVGSVSESVVVSADAVLVDTTSAASNTNVDKSFFDILPRSRGFQSLINIAPGSRSEAKSGGFQIDGASGAENTFFLDGMEVTNIQTGDLRGTKQVPNEFIKEVQIKSGGLEAQYGGAIGGVVNAVVRSGSNDFHGEGGMFYATDATNAGPRPTLRLDPNDDNIGNYFANTRDGQRYLNPSGQLGGKLIKDKLWFFAGFSPQWTDYDRTVKFLSGTTGSYHQTDRQDYSVGKLDYAPFTKLRLSGTYLYQPFVTHGRLPSQQGTDSPTSPWADLGGRTSGMTTTWQADWLVSSKLVITGRGGYDYRNYKDYGIPSGIYRRYLASTTTAKDPSGNLLTDIPAQWQGAAGIRTTNNQQTVLDQYTRWNAHIEANYTFSAAGQHTLKGGYDLNRLANNANASTWPDGYVRVGWGLSYSRITSTGPKARGTYGYYIDRFFATQGSVSGRNQGFFLQDNWRINKFITVNFGLRDESEYLPSYRTDSGIQSRAISFDWASKLAPRFGFAWDPTGQGKSKIYGSFGLFYDVMKYEMPRGSFGGDKWVDRVYTLNTPDIGQLKGTTDPNSPATPPASSVFVESVDWRIPSNSPDDNTIDPNLKPMRSRQLDFGYEFSINPTLVASARYSHRKLDRTIEDVGTLGPQGEKYFIANPGFGLTADPKTWDKGFPTTPKAVRDYDALELRLDKRFSKHYQFAGSYTLSRLYGNYGGLASSDEPDANGVGRLSPNVNRYFDLPFMSFNQDGGLVYGRLATDRPHTFKFFGGYSYDSKMGTTVFAPQFVAFSGTPLTTDYTMVSSVPIFVYGRGDLGRTPFYTNTDMNVYHDFKPFKSHEGWKIRLEATAFNVFNQNTVLGKNTSFVHPNDGQVNFDKDADFFQGFNAEKMRVEQELRSNPQFGRASVFQSPRNMRFQFRFSF